MDVTTFDVHTSPHVTRQGWPTLHISTTPAPHSPRTRSLTPSSPTCIARPRSADTRPQQRPTSRSNTPTTPSPGSSAARSSEIAIVENATRAWDMAFYGLSFAPGDRILTARAEYSSNVIAFLQVAARTGAVVEVVDNDESGQLSVEDLRRRLADDTGPVKLVAVTHVPTQGGLVNPAEDIGTATRDAGVPYLLDACQSVGQLPVDVDQIGCDFLSATGRKYLRGPRGTGFLYVRSNMSEQLEPPFLDLHAATWTAPDRYEIRPDARRFETWETNYAAKIGLGVAVDYALSWGMDAIHARVTTLADRLRELLGELKGVRVHDQGRRRCGIVTFTVDGVHSTEGPTATRPTRSQCERLPRRVRPTRPTRPRGPRPGAGVRPLLQHRGRAGPPHRRAPTAR